MPETDDGSYGKVTQAQVDRKFRGHDQNLADPNADARFTIEGWDLRPIDLSAYDFREVTLKKVALAMIGPDGLIKPLDMGDAKRAMHSSKFVFDENQKQIDAWLQTRRGWPERWQNEFEAKRNVYNKDPGNRFAWFEAIQMAFEDTINAADLEDIQLMRRSVESPP